MGKYESMFRELLSSSFLEAVHGDIQCWTVTSPERSMSIKLEISNPIGLSSIIKNTVIMQKGDKEEDVREGLFLGLLNNVFNKGLAAFDKEATDFVDSIH